MAKKTINLGTGPNTLDGDKVRTAFGKVNDNFDELYGLIGESSAGLEELVTDNVANALVSGDHVGIDVTYLDDQNKINLEANLSAVNQDIVPADDVTYDLGTPTKQWRSLYVGGNTIYLGGTALGVDGSDITVNGNPISSTINYSDIPGTPTLATVATSGSYNDLTDQPTIPTNVSELSNDSGYLSAVDWTQVTGKPALANVATSGSYNDLSDKPVSYTLPAATISNLGGVKIDGNSIVINGSNVISAAAVTANAQPNITSVGTLSSLTVTGNITTGNVLASNYYYSNGAPFVSSNYGDSNVTTLLSSLGNNNITTLGNVQAAYLVGDGSGLTNITANVAGNIQGTGSNVSLVAGNFTMTFDNTGKLTLPTMGGDEGGEINLGVPATNTTLNTRVVVDVYRDQVRFFDGSTKGAYIDLSQAATGVGSLLNNRVSAFVNAGTFVTMDNIRATVTTGGNRGLSLATVTGFFTYNIGGTYGAGVGSGGASLSGQTLTTTPTTSIFGWSFPATGDISTYVITNTSSLETYRITVQIGASFNNNSIVIERLI